jgi:hypothetical protein
MQENLYCTFIHQAENAIYHWDYKTGFQSMKATKNLRQTALKSSAKS